MCAEPDVTPILPFISSLNIAALPENWDEKIRKFYRILIKQNESFNLTRITHPDDFLFKHIADSLLIVSILPEIRTAPWSIADIGCGAGFPGIPLALTFPKLNLTEIDSSRKKVNFTETLATGLGLDNCRSAWGQARELSRSADFQGKFDLVIARAVKDTAYQIREFSRFVKADGGRLVSYKTPRTIERERLAVIHEAKKFRYTAETSPILELPNDYGQRQFWVLKKE